MKRHALILLALVALAACDSMPRVPSWMGGGDEEKPRLPGQRIDVLPEGASLQPDESMKELPISLPPPMPNSEWLQHGPPVSSAAGNLAAGGNFDNEQSARVGSGEAFERSSVPQPVVGGGLVFAMDANGNISAHEAGHIGNLRWESKGVSESDNEDVLGGGLAYQAGRLYATSGRGRVAAFDAATGQELWHRSMHVSFNSAPRVAGDKLFATTIDNQAYAMSIANGEAVWSQRGISESAGIMNAVTPAVTGDTLVVPYSSGEIYVLTASSGKELWNDSLTTGAHTQATASFSGIGGDPVVDDNILFALSSNGMLSVKQLVTGQPIWTRAVGSLNTPWLAGDYLYVLASDNTLVCFVKYSGRIRWVSKLRSYEDEEEKLDPIAWRGPVLVDGKLVLVSSDGELLLVSALDGKTVSSKSVSKDIRTSPVVAGGVLYFVGRDATLYSFQ